MSPDEARKLATRLIDTYPNGPKAYIWRDTLTELDAHDAADAYHDLLKSAERTPTIAHFLAAYHAIRRRRHSTPHRNQPDGTEITLGEYLTRITRRAQTGNQDALDELERWQRFLGANPEQQAS